MPVQRGSVVHWGSALRLLPLPLSAFVPGTSRDDYIFYMASLWSDEEAPGTNQHRAHFIDGCKSLAGVIMFVVAHF